MPRRLVVLLFIVTLAGSWTLVSAAAIQSAHFPVTAPAGSAGSGDDLGIGVQTIGLGAFATNGIDLVPTDTSIPVARKASRAVCQAAFAKFGNGCSVVFVGAPGPTAGCVAGAANNAVCCDALDPAIADRALTMDCLGSAGKGFEMARVLAGDGFTTSALGAAGSVTNLTLDNKSIYTDVTWDAALRALIQIRPNGVTGNVTLRITHTQGGVNPRIATLVVNSTNNDPSEAQALHNALNTALTGTGLGLTTVTHSIMDAIAPLTAFGFLKQATHFSEISNVQVQNVQSIEVIVQPGMGFTIEGTDNTPLSQLESGIPTLNTYGIVVLVVMLLLAGYLLKRRQRMGGATA